MLFLVPTMPTSEDYRRKPELHPNYQKIRETLQCDVPLCEEKFYSVGALRKHRKEKHKDEKDRLKCPRCPFTAAGTRLLIHHFQSYHEDKVRHCCEVCGESIKSDFALAQHKLRH